MKSLIAQIRAELSRTLRNRRFAMVSIALPLILYLVFSKAMKGAQAAEAAKYILISMTAFSLVGTGINTFGLRLASERNRGWTKVLKVTPMPAWVYLGAKLIVQTLLNLVSVAVLFGAAMLNGTTMPTAVWLGSAAWLLIGCLPFLALGALIGMALPVETAQPVGNLVYLVLSLLGGLWMDLQALPDWMQQLGKWMPTYRFASGAWNLVLGKAIDWQDAVVLLGYTILFVILSIRLERRQEAKAAA